MEIRGATMTNLQCINCRRRVDHVRLVEHGTDDMALCSACFGHLQWFLSKDRNMDGR